MKAKLFKEGEKDYQVWLDTDDWPDKEGTIIGLGETPHKACVNAMPEVKALYDHLNTLCGLSEAKLALEVNVE